MSIAPTSPRIDFAATQWTGDLPAAPSRIDATIPSGEDDQARFLREMVRRLDGKPGVEDTAEDLAGLAAQRLVSTTFVEPIVRDARENSAPTGRFAPGTAEQRFGHLMDRTLADAIVSQPGFAGVASLERRLLDQIERQLAANPVEVSS